MSLMVSISGIRGTIGDSLTPDVVVKYAAGFAEYCNRGTIIVGRDGRITGKSISQIVTATLQEMGCEVISLGICPTPTVALAVERLKAAGGIAITASHNPMIWNGLKFFASTGLFLDAEENKAFWSMAERMPHTYVSWDRQGLYRVMESYIDEHIQSVLKLSLIDPAAIKRRKFKVVLDCVNAAGGVIVPRLLDELGCEVIPLNCDVSGVFRHTPEPIPENLTDLRTRVRETGADLGIAVDPDVDRLVLIDERGEPFGEEYTIASCVKFVLDKEMKTTDPGRRRVVVNLSTTRAVDDIVKAAGADLQKTAVGEINVAKRMKEIGAVIGGEGSGGVILPRVHTGRDAIVGIGLVLQSLTEFGGTLSALKATLPAYDITKGKIELGNIDADALLARLAVKFSSEGTVNTVDGLKLDFANAWVHFRKSNTEPIIRIIAEAPVKSEADRLVQRFTEEILHP